MSSPKERISVPGSNRDPLPGARAIGEANENERFEVTVYVRPASANQISNHVRELSSRKPHERKHVSHKEFESTHGASAQDIQKVEAFARDHGLEVKDVHNASRRVKLSGTVASFNAAFGVNLKRYEHSKGVYRGRTGEIMIPKDLESVVKSVHGLDNRPQVRPL